MLENPRLSCEAVGFVDDDPGKLGRTIHGVPVVGAVGDLGRYLDRYDVKHVFVTIGRVPSETMRGIVEACEDRGVPVKVLPGMGEIIGGEVSLKSMRDVEYGDLLGRESVHLDAENIRGYLTDHVVMVTGCGGSIGSELCRQIVRFNPRELVLLDAAEPGLFATEMQLRQKMKFSNCTAVLGSVADEGLMNRLFARHRPAVVLHAAAYKHVPMLEANPWAAVTNNVLGSLVVMRAAVSHGVGRFVLVSSDKAVRPSNVMGASKRVVELIMHSLSGNGTIFMAVRFGNVLGSSGSVVPIFMEQIRAGGPVTVTHRDASRYFMSIPEAAQLILQAGGIGTGGETFVLDMGKPVKIDAMARDLIRLCGSEPDSEIGIVYSGLRPGEKLHEELMTDGEGVAETMHKGILVLRQNGSPRYSAAELEREIDELRRLADGHDAAAIRAKFAEIVPEYAVQYSPSVL
jgi:FlaA1/EpsC-like NDP-sugar epimerase